MFENSRRIIDRTIKEFRFTVYFITILSQAITAGYMIYLCCVGKGTLGLNIAMASICAAYLILATAHFVSEGKRKNKEITGAKDILKRVKLVIKTVMLAISIYGIYLADKDASGIAIILATLSIIMWILEVLLEIALSFVKVRSAQFIEALKEDVKPSHLAQGATNLVREKVADFVENADKAFDKVCGVAIDVGAAVAKNTVRKFNPFRKLKERKNMKKALAAKEQEKLPQPK